MYSVTDMTPLCVCSCLGYTRYQLECTAPSSKTNNECIYNNKGKGGS